jgi:hypothetical protein
MFKRETGSDALAVFDPIQFGLNPATTLVTLPRATVATAAEDVPPLPASQFGLGASVLAAAEPAARPTTLDADTTPDYHPWAAGFVEAAPEPALIGVETSLLAGWGVIADADAGVDAGPPASLTAAAAPGAPVDAGDAAPAVPDAGMPAADTAAAAAGIAMGDFGWVEPSPVPGPDVAPEVHRGAFGFYPVEPAPLPVPPPETDGRFAAADDFLF